MNTFTLIYLFIGLILYVTVYTVICYIGIDNFKNLTDDEDIKNIDLNSLLPNIILLLLCTLFWPIVLINVISKKNNY